MLNHKTIRGLFSNTVYTRGLEYYNDTRVQQLTYNKSDSKWHAKVLGDDVYNVDISLKDDRLLYFCECHDHKEYRSCEHTVAVLLEIADKLEEQAEIALRLKREEELRNLTSEIIDQFADNSSDSTGKPSPPVAGQPIKVEYILKIEQRSWDNPLLSLEMKVGINRVYVVKSMKNFLTHIKEQEELFFAKNYSYEPEFQYFKKGDQEIIDLLIQINESESFYKDLDRFSYGHSKQQKGITIPPLFADQVMDLLAKRPCKLQYDVESFDHFFWTDEQLPFSFQLEKDYNGNFTLYSQANSTDYLEEYGYAVVNNTIYKLRPEQQVILAKMDKVFHSHSNSSIPISDEQIGPFLSYVVPRLKKLGNVDIAEEVAKNVVQPKLDAKLYLDQHYDRLLAKIEYHYGESIIYPYPLHSNEASGSDEDGILIREVDKERDIMKVIEMAGFKYNGTELYIDDADFVFTFMYDLLPQLEGKVAIYLSDNVRRVSSDEQHIPSVKVDLDARANLLEVNFDFADVDQSEISNIFKSLVEKKRFYRMPDGTFIPLEEETYSPIANLFNELDITPEAIKDGSVALPAYRSLQVGELMSASKSVEYNQSFMKLIDDIKSPHDNKYELPTTLKADLREYQETGFQWLKALNKYRFGGILADDMGLGKTLQSITFLLSEKEEQGEEFQQALVVSPASLIYNWKNEFEKFSPSLNVLVISGNKEQREAKLKDIGQYDVIITSYPLIRQDVELYSEYQFSTLILDEAQAIKNHLTKTAKAIKSIRASRRFALSGTPIENSLEELWSIFDAILPGFFVNKKAFNNLPQEQISRMSRPFILRRLKKDVLKELPDRIEAVHRSELTTDQKKLYLGYLEKIQNEAATSFANEGFQKNRMKILAGLTRLRQLCCHPSLFIENYEGESGKLNQLLEMVDNALENNQRILIFSQFSSMLKIIEKRLVAEKKEVFYLDGQTPSNERVEMAERFNNGEREIFLISLKAGGTGLNLTGADTVILYDLWWNPAVEEQAAGRAHRMGQKKVVQVFRLITNGTIEEKIFAMQQKKKELIENIIHPGETMFSSLTEDDIRELLNV